MSAKTFSIINFGCRATQADGAALEETFLNDRYQKAAEWRNSDIVVINTCTVTQAADAEARAAIRRVHRENPGARLVITGCYAQRAPGDLAMIEGVSCVVGNSHKDQLVSILSQSISENEIAGESPTRLHNSAGGASVYCSSIFESRELRTIGNPGGAGRTRPVLKIQDGCSYRCSFCVIPYVRGDSRSLPSSEVLDQTRKLLDQGYKEITLTGIHLGGYGRDLKGEGNLAEVVRLILREDHLRRLRLSSVEPLEYTDDLIALVAESPKMAKHFHVPLQSGCDRILRLMRRPYTADFYRRLVEKMRHSVPDAAIGADVMVGFPGETAADHAETMAMLETTPMTYLHVFPYSRRPGTVAASMRQQVHNEIVSERSLQLRNLAERKNQKFKESFVGRKLEVVTLGWKSEEDVTEALSSNYLKVMFRSVDIKSNEWIQASITGVSLDGLWAQVDS